MASFQGFASTSKPLTLGARMSKPVKPVDVDTSAQKAASNEILTKAISNGSSSVHYQYVPVSRADRKVLNVVVRPLNANSFALSGTISPSQGYMADQLSMLEYGLAYAASPEAFKNSDVASRFAVKPGMSLQDAVNAFVNFASSVLKMQVSKSSFPSVVAEMERLAIGVIDQDAPKVSDEEMAMFGLGGAARQLDVSEPAGVAKAVSISADAPSVHLAPGVGNVDPVVYNETRFAFINHTPLAGNRTIFGDQIDDYFRVYPTYDEVNHRLMDQQQSGLILCTKTEDLASQTIFHLDAPSDDVIHLLDRSDKHVVARFTKVFVEDVVPEHHHAQRSGKQTKLDTLYANTQIVSVTPAALHWMVKTGNANGVVNRKNVKVCVGFDPLYTLITKDGVSLCALLMDEKLSNLTSAGQMTLRSLTRSTDTPAIRQFPALLHADYASLICYYSPARSHDYPGIFSIISHDVPDGLKLNVEASRHCLDCPELRAKIAALEAQLAAKTPVALPPSSTAAPVSIAPLVAQLRDLAAENASLISDLQNARSEIDTLKSDLASAGVSSLNVYLKHHTCLNHHAKESDLLSSLRADPTLVDQILGKRKAQRAQWCEKISKECSVAHQDEVDALKVANQKQVDEILSLHATLEQKDAEMAELANAFAQAQSTFQSEMKALIAKNLELDKRNRQQATSLKITPELLSATPVDVPDSAPAPDFDVPIDEL
uniref:Mu 3 n=1 Tax=Phocid orthoreovirus 1 TaxID=2854225 RepID=A0A7L5EP18_9REOV|nr:Mu 3 [Phocid orthoreovirus 1]